MLIRQAPSMARRFCKTRGLRAFPSPSRPPACGATLESFTKALEAGMDPPAIALKPQAIGPPQRCGGGSDALSVVRSGHLEAVGRAVGNAGRQAPKPHLELGIA